MPTYDIGAYIPSLKEPQHKTYLGNASVYTGYLDQANQVGAASGTTGDTVVVPLITLPHGALVDKWEIRFSAFGGSGKCDIGFRYKNPAAAVANPRYGVAGKGMPTASATEFATDIDVSSAGTTSALLFAPFLCQADIEIILTVNGQTGDIVPANATIALMLTGRNKGAL
jgi:hypothetical protein